MKNLNLKVSVLIIACGMFGMAASTFAQDSGKAVSILEGSIPPYTAVACNAPVAARVSTVTMLTKCGQPVRNSRLLGALNRLNKCNDEKVLAVVFANPKTCSDCATTRTVRDIRAQRCADTCTCPSYVNSLVSSLASSSLRVRLAAKVSLRKCGYRVKTETACVQADVPSVTFYK